MRYRSNWTLKELVLRRRENLSTRGKTSQSKGENQKQTKNWFWGEGKTWAPGEKPLKAKERTNNKLNPHICGRLLDLNIAPHWKGVFPIVRQHCFPYPSPPLLPHIGIEKLFFDFQEWGYYSFPPPPHPLRMFFTAFFISRILQQYTTGFIKELTKITVPEKS